MRVSHETIYRSLFIQARGMLKKELLGHLRSRRMMRRAQAASTTGQPRGQIVDGVSIRDRPAHVEDRAIPGHWEGDLITGAQNTHLAILVERQSRFTMLVKVPGKDTASVVTALSMQIRQLPAALRRSLTWDRGMELAQHRQLTLATKVQVFFCDPQSPWQRGTNENTNRLLRQYFPKGTTLSQYSQADLDRIALRLNQRPRKTLGFQTPAAILEASRKPTWLNLGCLQAAYAGYALPGPVAALAVLVLVLNLMPFLYGTAIVLVLAYVLHFLPAGLQSLEPALQQITPNLEEAARTLGIGVRDTWRRVTLPLIRNGFIAAWVLMFLQTMKELPATLLLRPVGFDTLAIRVWQEASEEYYQLAAPSALLIVLVACQLWRFNCHVTGARPRFDDGHRFTATPCKN